MADFVKDARQVFLEVEGQRSAVCANGRREEDEQRRGDNGEEGKAEDENEDEDEDEDDGQEG